MATKALDSGAVKHPVRLGNAPGMSNFNSRYCGGNTAGTSIHVPSVAVIVLNWNGRDDTIACIESLQRVDYPNFALIVVDNGSTDGSVAAIQPRFPNLEIIETRRNLGFAEGNNVGIRLALERGADYVFLLNNDTVVHPSLLRELVAAAERCPEGGIFSPKIFYHAEPTRIWYAGVAWDSRRLEFRHLQDDDPQIAVDERGVAKTDYACGCAFLVRSGVLRKVGLLDPTFFLMYEESDLCFRALRGGFGSYFVPAAVLWHKISASFGGAESPLITYFMTRNRLLWGERHLQRREILQLYRMVWWELNKRLIPRFDIGRGSYGFMHRLYDGARTFATSVVERWREPQNQAFLWGTFHYFIRRFGDAPEHVRMLARSTAANSSSTTNRLRPEVREGAFHAGRDEKTYLVKALFVSTHFPYDFRKNATGTFKRMRVFLDALKERVSLRLLFYYSPNVEVDARRVKETKAAMKSEWELDDLELVVCREERDPDDSKRLWSRYVSRALSMHRQSGFVSTSGPDQLRAFEDCLDDRPDFIFAHRLAAMCPALKTRRTLPPIFMDLDDIEHKAFRRDISQPPMWGAKRLYYLHLPAMLLGERRAIKLSTKSFVCSVLDQQYLAHKWKLPNVKTIPNSIRLPDRKPICDEPVLLYLGAYMYPPNAIAAEHLITHIWPLIRKIYPRGKLVIAGPGPERIACFGQQHAGVEYAGFVDDLDALYSSVRVVCCPIRSGGGTRIKIIEAAAYCKPVVSTHVGAEGLDFEDGREILLRDESQAFADACVELFRSDALCARLGQAAREKAEARYDRRRVIQLIQDEIFGALNAVNAG